MDPVSELVELLTRFVGTVTIDDLEDEVFASLCVQLYMILNPEPEAMPVHLIHELSDIKNTLDRFKVAAKAVQADTPEKMRALLLSMRHAGLVKKEENVF
jgi:hypothetical protein